MFWRRISGEYRAAMVFTAGASILFVAGIYLMNSFGANFVYDLEHQVGDTVVAEARRNARVGDVDGAYEKYKLALAAKFADPQQSQWIRREFVRYLLSEAAYEQAIEESVNFADRQLFEEVCQALMANEQWESLQNAGVLRFDWAQEARSRHDMALARFWEGIGWREQAMTEKATKAFLSSWEIKPLKQVALEVAPFLSENGHAAKAMAMLKSIT
jgi:hypothetical protein